jgi:hypothetical protein
MLSGPAIGVGYLWSYDLEADSGTITDIPPATFAVARASAQSVITMQPSSAQTADATHLGYYFQNYSA